MKKIRVAALAIALVMLALTMAACSSAEKVRGDSIKTTVDL